MSSAILEKYMFISSLVNAHSIYADTILALLLLPCNRELHGTVFEKNRLTSVPTKNIRQ